MINLLVVDNNPRDHERYRALLAGESYRVLCCAEGGEALRVACDKDPPLSGAVILWELPGQPGGAELLTYLRREHSHLPLIVVSELLDLSRAAAARALGACDFLLKPLDRERFRVAVRRALSGRPGPPLFGKLKARLVGESPQFEEMLEALATVIPHQAETVLLIGENGTGKELLARAVHDLSAPLGSRWVAVNVASIPANLIEAALFGHEAGAFTDARNRRIGLLEESGGGTLFLDEIGELQLPVQSTLLRAIQERRYRRVGGSEDLDFQARLVLATNRNLIAEATAGLFRKDLYFRIARNEVRVPPLRQRGEDLWLLVEHFLEKHGGGPNIRLARETRDLLVGYPFPGNVRELEDLIKQALLRCTSGVILPFDLPVAIMEERQAPSADAPEPEGYRWPERLWQLPQKKAVHEIEQAFNREYLQLKLREAGGKKERAAELAGLDPKTFRAKLKDAGLEPLSGT